MTTRGAVCRKAGEPWEITELDDPQAGKILVKLHAAGLCHSDDHVQKSDAPMPMPMVGGHDGAGVVEAVGPVVTRVNLGDHVTCSFISVCGTGMTAARSRAGRGFRGGSRPRRWRRWYSPMAILQWNVPEAAGFGRRPTFSGIDMMAETHDDPSVLRTRRFAGAGRRYE